MRNQDCLRKGVREKDGKVGGRNWEEGLHGAGLQAPGRNAAHLMLSFLRLVNCT